MSPALPYMAGCRGLQASDWDANSLTQFPRNRQQLIAWLAPHGQICALEDCSGRERPTLFRQVSRKLVRAYGTRADTVAPVLRRT